MTNNGDNNFTVDCPHCGQRFSVVVPKTEILNTPKVSIAVTAHEKPIKCICGGSCVIAARNVQTAWAIIPLTGTASSGFGRKQDHYDAAGNEACSLNWNFFHRRVCLTNNEAEWQIAQAEFTRVGLEVEKYQAVKEIGPHQSFSHSERNILLDFLHSDAETLLHLEDDCVFRDLTLLPAALLQLPADWDIVYLGANLVLWNNGEPQPERYSEHLFRVKCAWTTHAIAYNKKCVRTILEKQPMFSTQMFDNFLSDLLPGLNAFIVAPMVAYQRPRYSSIWDRETDYNDVFLQSQARLK